MMYIEPMSRNRYWWPAMLDCIYSNGAKNASEGECQGHTETRNDENFEQNVLETKMIASAE
jgi:hypothetical protein